MRSSLLISGLVLSCGGDSPPCEDGFHKVDGRWCVYDEAPLIIPASSDEEPEPEPEEEEPPEKEVDDPSDYVNETEDIEALLSLAQIEHGVETAIAEVQSIDPEPLHQLYEDLQTDGDASCPNYDEDYTIDYPDRLYWRDACTVSAGASFSGYVYSYDFGAYIDASETYDYRGYAYFNGSSKIIDWQGNSFIGSGYSSYYERDHIAGEYTSYYNSVTGNFRTDDPAYADTWLARDLNISLSVAGHRYEEGSTSLTYSASISGMEGDINAIRLDEVFLYSEDLGSMCELEPSGSISVRDEAGSWYEVEFDGPKYSGAGAFPPDCDGCGRVYFRGELLGEVCPDFTLLQVIEERPWG
jgi:hypothetical protein